MKKYRVTGHFALIGVGIILYLSDEQAITRRKSLKQKKKNIYVVVEPVQFKQGEEIVVVSGELSKAVLLNLHEIKAAK